MRNLRTRTFVTAGIPSTRPTCPAAPRSPTPRPASGSRAARCAAATPTRSNVYTPQPTERELRAAGSFYDRDLDNYRRIELADQPGQNSGTPPGRPARSCASSSGTCARPRRRRTGPGSATVTPKPRDAERVLARSDLPAHVGALPAPARGANDPLDYVNSVEAYLGARLHLHRGAAAPSRARSRASCSTRSPATASSTRARWRCCCGWAASPRAWPPASPPAPTTARPRSTSCATSTPTRGSRRGSPTYGWVTFDPTPSAAPPRSQSCDRGAAAIGDAPDLGGGGALDPRAGLAAQDGDAVGALRRPRPARRAAARRRRVRVPASRPPAGPAARARARAAAHAPRPRARARRCRRSRRRSTARPTPRATCARCATSATAAAATRPRAPSGAACAASWGAAAGCADGSAHGGRCRRDAPNRLVQLIAHG